jgi:5-methyltetrahydrofolate--homocysteine methyltransferase
MSTLLDPSSKDDFADDIADEYSDVRQEHYESLKDRKYVTLETARSLPATVNYSQCKSFAPLRLGVTTFLNYDFNRIVPYIDWKPFFDVWQLKGKYPNRGYPKIFNDKDVG